MTQTEHGGLEQILQALLLLHSILRPEQQVGFLDVADSQQQLQHQTPQIACMEADHVLQTSTAVSSMWFCRVAIHNHLLRR